MVCVGVATLDAIAAVERYPGPDERVLAHVLIRAGGGPAATAAVTLARLGVPVSFVGMTGDDVAGQAIRDGLVAEGVDISELATRPGSRSGESLIVVSNDGRTRAICAFPGTVGPPVLSRRALRLCMGADWVHLDHAGYGVIDGLRRAGDGPKLSIDVGNPVPNLRLAGISLFAPSRAMLSRRYPNADTTQAMRQGQSEGADMVTVTLGEEGSAAAAGDEIVFVPAYQAEVRSTLGAGDVFHGALLAALLQDRPLGEALHLANVVAGLSCRALDGRSAIPTRSELIQMGLHL